MSDPQQPPSSPPPAPPSGSAPQAYPGFPPAAQAGPPAPSAYPQPSYPTPPAVAYPAPPGAFVGPAGGYAAPYAPGTPAPGAPALGRVALILSLIATVVLTIVGAVLTWRIGQGASSTIDVTSFESGSLGFLTPVRDLVLWFEITGWTATAIGIWALVQGIVAIAKRRGRGAGIAAVIIAGIGPFVFAFVVYVTLIAGAAAGVSAR